MDNKEPFASVWKLLNEEKIEYVCFNIDHEDGTMEFDIPENDREKTEQLLYERDFIRIYDEYDPEGSLWKMPRTESHVFIRIHTGLYCRRLFSREWKRLWTETEADIRKNRKWDREREVWIPDKETDFIMSVLDAVFNKKAMSHEKKRELAEKNADADHVRARLGEIFGSYGDILTENILSERKTDIIGDYIGFMDY